MRIDLYRLWSFSGPYFPVFGLNTDQKNSEYGYFSRSAKRLLIYILFRFNRDCPKYEDVLPNGMCYKYLKTNRIAQTVKIMHRKNKDLYGFYEIGFKFIQLWFTGNTPKMSFIKQWLGE